MAILESVRETPQVLICSHEVLAWLAVRAKKNLKASPAYGCQEDSESLRTAGPGQGSSGALAIALLHLVVPVCDSPQAEVTDAAIFPGLRCWGCLLHLQIHERMYVFYKWSERLMFLIDGPSVAQLLGSDWFSNPAAPAVPQMLLVWSQRAGVVSHREDPNWSDPWEIGHCNG